MISTTTKPRILVFCEYYRPGYKSGGGMRTVVNMVDRLSDHFDFRIITHDHDGNLDTEQYTAVKINDWNSDGESSVYYISNDKIGIKVLRRLINHARPDAIYSNSFFSSFTRLLLQLRKLRLLSKVRIVIAPCGELSDAALQISPKKKMLYLRLSRSSGLYNNVIWKASTDLEKAEIERLGFKNATFFVAPDLPAQYLLKNYDQRSKPEKQSGEVRMIFLSRFVRKKNFKWLLEQLGGNINGKLVIDVYGPLEDAEYWQECWQIIETLPNNITVNACGSIPHKAALEKLFEYHFFLLPTLGENFGHVFIESLAAGCPMLISDRTPWLHLAEKGIGWDLPLSEPEKWVATLNLCIQMDNKTYSRTAAAARVFAEKWLADQAIEQMTIDVLNESLGTNTILSSK